MRRREQTLLHYVCHCFRYSLLACFSEHCFCFQLILLAGLKEFALYVTGNVRNQAFYRMPRQSIECPAGQAFYRIPRQSIECQADQSFYRMPDKNSQAFYRMPEYLRYSYTDRYYLDNP